MSPLCLNASPLHARLMLSPIIVCYLPATCCVPPMDMLPPLLLPLFFLILLLPLPSLLSLPHAFSSSSASTSSTSFLLPTSSSSSPTPSSSPSFSSLSHTYWCTIQTVTSLTRSPIQIQYLNQRSMHDTPSKVHVLNFC